jgi:hypothetical protein
MLNVFRQILFDKYPYCNRSEPGVLLDIIQGIKPFTRPSVTDRLEERLWELLEACWAAQPNDRLSALEFMDGIKNIRANDRLVARD